MAKQTQSTVSPKQRREQFKAERQKRNQRYGLIGLLALVIIGVGLLLNQQQERQRQALADAFEGELASVAYDGSQDAPIQIVEYGDFGCHACRAWHNQHIKTLLKAQYGDQIAFQFRHFPVITPQSPLAAEAAQCAAEQDGFWAYHDYIYEVTPQGALSERNLKTYAADVDLDTVAFDQCLDSRRYETYVEKELSDARAAGARGTPTFIINGEQVNFSPDAMSAKIDSLLDG
ncbi:MAG: DsbA family protein [Candidatus Promineifilaceae bacterium]